jgi:hypothetical protein
MFYVNMNPTMSNKNLANGEYPNVGPLWFKYNQHDNTNNTQELKTW